MLKTVHPDHGQLAFDQFIHRFPVGDFLFLLDRKDDVLINGQAVKQRAHLKTKAVLPTDFSQLFFAEKIDPLTFKIHLAAAGPLQNNHVFHQDRLAASAPPDDDRGFTLLDRHGHIVQNQPIVVSLGQLPNYDNPAAIVDRRSDHKASQQRLDRPEGQENGLGDHGIDEVNDQNRDKTADKRLGTGLTDTLGAFPAGESLIASNNRDCPSEK